MSQFWADYCAMVNGQLAEKDARIAVLEAALREIKRDHGRVCAEFELCDHPACASSYGAWEIARSALAGQG